MHPIIRAYARDQLEDGGWSRNHRLALDGGTDPQRSSQARPGKSHPTRVFISSTPGALASDLQAAANVCHRLGFTPVYMENFDPLRLPPVDLCRQMVDTCDVFVLLLAHRYGSRPPGQSLSYSELEYNWATSQPQKPLLAFVVDPTFPWPPQDIDHGADADALAEFVTRVRSQHIVKQITTDEGFREDFVLALMQSAHTFLLFKPCCLAYSEFVRAARCVVVAEVATLDGLRVPSTVNQHRLLVVVFPKPGLWPALQLIVWKIRKPRTSRWKGCASEPGEDRLLRRPRGAGSNQPGPVNVAVANDAGEILMIRRIDNGNWAVPGGAIDFGKSSP